MAWFKALMLKMELLQPAREKLSVLIVMIANKYSAKALLLIAFLLPSLAYGDTGFNPALMMSNLGIIAKIVQAVAVVMGVGLIFSGIMKLKHYGEMRTMMNSQGSLANALFIVLAGVMLLTLPTMLNTFLLAIWGTTNPLPYPGGDNMGTNGLMRGIVMFVRLIGVISFIRGVVLISHLGKENGGQQGSIGKALTYMIGGIMCVQIVATAQFLSTILGFVGV
jgi:intracellular multiplication protein IcmC